MLLGLREFDVCVQKNGHFATLFPQVVDHALETSEGGLTLFTPDLGANFDNNTEVLNSELSLQSGFQLEQRT